MSLTTEGIYAEKLARAQLRAKGYANIQQLDWLVNDGDRLFAVEVKHRELFAPPPFIGTGMDIKQINRRTELNDQYGIDTLLMVFEKNEQHYYTGWLSNLEKTNYFDTKNGIRIYEISNFKKHDIV